MKKLLLLLTVVQFTSVFAQHGLLCSKHKIERYSNERTATLSLDQIALTEEYDVTFYFLDIALERTNTDVSGSTEIHAKAIAPVLDTFMFELHPDLTIDSILLNGVTPQLFNQDGSAVICPVSYTTGDEFFMKVFYQGTAPTSGGSALGGDGLTNGTSGSWGNQVTWSLSEPFSAYEWFPCKQSLTDKADSVWVWVTTDNSNKVGSQGLLSNITDMGGGKDRYEWKSSYPIVYYLISVSVAEYVEHSFYANPVGAAGPVLIQNYIYDNPACLPFFLDDIEETDDYMEHYSEIFGLYPFELEKYGHAMAPFGGGMEHQTMTTQGFFFNTLTAHEIAHQWFGDHVTCDSWADIWVNEGFASYSEEIMLAEYYPGDEVSSMSNRHDNIMEEPDGAVWVEDSLNPSRVFDGRLTYNKGAAILHTLRFLIDDDALFYQTLQDFQTTYSHSSASGDDFKEVAETVTSLELDPFFNEWYYGEGYPTYGIEYLKIGGTLHIQLNQTTSASSITPLFTNDLEIRIVGTGTENQVVRLTGIDAASTYHSVAFPEEVESISVDPYNWIINQDGAIGENPAGFPDLISEEIKLYPNPVDDELRIQVPQSMDIRILDIQGRTILEESFEEGTQSLNVSDLSSGKYFLISELGVHPFVKR